MIGWINGERKQISPHDIAESVQLVHACLEDRIPIQKAVWTIIGEEIGEARWELGLIIPHNSVNTIYRLISCVLDGLHNPPIRIDDIHVYDIDKEFDHGYQVFEATL